MSTLSHKYLSPTELLVSCGEEPPPEETRPPIAVNESPVAVVETEEELDEALEKGRGAVIRGLVPCTSAKTVRHAGTEIFSENGQGGLIFSLDPASGGNPRAITIEANGCCFRDFRLTSTTPVEESTCYGLVFSEQLGTALKSHRTRIERMRIDNWARCLSKDGGTGTPLTQDVLISDTICHTWSMMGAYLNFGFERLTVQRCQFRGRLAGESHTTSHAGAGLKGGANWRDCTVRDCISSDCDGMGYEVTKSEYTLEQLNERTRFIGCLATRTKSFGFSLGFCRDGMYSHCEARDVGMVGFELCGRGPAYPAPEGQYGSGIIDSCVVDGVSGVIDSTTGLDTGAMGFSIDGAEDVSIRGATRISNINSGDRSKNFGIVFYGSERCSVRGVAMRDFGVYGLYFRRGYSPNTGGHHVAEGNEFRNSPGDSECLGIHIQDTTVSCRNNTNLAATGTNMNNQSHCVTPAKAIVDGADVPGDAFIRGTNITVAA